MLPRKIKAAYYQLFGPFMRINGAVYRWFRATKEGELKVQLGPGKVNYLPGWVNVDANMFTGKCDVWADLRNKLPFRDNTVDVFYSYHMIEHLPDLQFHFDEMFRCLKGGGVIRIGGPNGDNAIKKFVENDHGWFSDFPDKRESIGGRFENFVFCRREHLTILTYSFLKELLKASGFKDIRLCNPITQTHHPNIIGDDVLGKEHEFTPDCPHTIIVEATKGV